MDGRIFSVGIKPADKDSMFADDWFPIQVKQMDKVGRPDIDAFQTVMLREGENGRQRGFFVVSDTPATLTMNAWCSTSGRVESLSS